MRRTLRWVFAAVLVVSCAGAPRRPAAPVEKEHLRYRLQAIPKGEAIRIDERHVRTAIGAIVELEREDAANYYVRLYEPSGPATGPVAADDVPAPSAPEPPGSPVAAGEGAMRLVDFGAGLPHAGQWREGFGIGDVDGDGHPDLVFPPARKSAGAPVIFLGDGKGNWKRWREARFPPLPYDYGDAQVADLDGDGIADIALAMHHRGIVALLGDGKGGFRNGSEGLDYVERGDRVPAFSSRCLRAFDVRGRGRTDLVAVGEGPIIPFGGASGGSGFGLVTYENLGGGHWSARRPVARRNAPFGSSMAVGDFDGDGRLDVAIATGILGGREIVEFGTADGWRPGEVDALRPDGYLSGVAAADLDGDGVDDLVVAGSYPEGEETWAGALDVFLSRDHGRRWEMQTLVRGEPVVAVAAGHLAGPSSPAVVVALTDVGKLLIFVRDAREGWTRPSINVPETGCSGAAIRLSDLEGNGRQEIIATFADEDTSTRSGRCPSQGSVAAWKIER
jgi:hypothetical protein